MSVALSRTMATWPFQNMKSPRCRLEKSAAGSNGRPSDASCMSLSRGQGVPPAVHRELHQRGAIEAEAGLAAPEIGHAEEALGDSDEVTLA